MIQDEYGRVSDEILYDIADACNINAPNFGSAEWVADRMQKQGAFLQKQRKRIWNIAYDTDLKYLANQTLKDIEHEFPQVEGIIPRDERVRLTVRAVANQTSQYYGALNATMLRSANQLYQTALTEIERKMLLATESIIVGMATKASVTKDVLQMIQKTGVTGFVDKAGRKWSAEAYADLVTRSSMGNIQRQIMIDRCRDYGEDIVYAPIKFPSRPLCAEWQGKLLSLSERHYFTNDLNDNSQEVFPYSDAVGHPAGLWGCNCGHGKAVFIPNLSEIVQPDNVMTPEKNLEEYALTQKERELERNIRNGKTQVTMLEKAGVTGDELAESQNKLKMSQTQYKEFLRKNNLDPTAGRTYVYGYNGRKTNIVGDESKIYFDEKILNREKFAGVPKLVKNLANEYNTRLTRVLIGAEKSAGDVDISGERMRLNTGQKTTVLHEFAHTLTSTISDKYGLTHDQEFWKEIRKINRQYHKDVDAIQDTTRWISTYEHSSRNVDEFFAEAFAHAKARELGFEIPIKYGRDFTYSQMVLDTIDKYFKKQK